MRALVIVGAAALGLAAPAAAQVDAPGDAVHVVGPGDTLWDLARRYLSDPFLWPEIFSANRDVVGDPDLIFPAERLRIPGLRTAEAGRAPVGAPFGVPAQPRTAGRTVFFSGAEAASADAPSVVLRADEADLPAVPPGSFYAAGVLVPDSMIAEVGRLAELVSPTVIPLQSGPQIQPYDRVYMTLTAPVAPGDRLQLLRRGREVEPYGRIYASTGLVEVVAVDGDVATVEVQTMFDAVQVGDVAVALPAYEPRTEGPVPATGLEGVLLALDPDQPVTSREDLGYVNLGQASGVVEGDEFAIYLPPTDAGWGTRPAEEVARVQVVRAELITSAVRVVSMKHPAIEAGLPVRLIARMVGNRVDSR